MKPLMLVAGVCFATAAGAELKDDHFMIGPEQVWIEFSNPVETMWVGRNEYERTQVLSGPDVEIAALAADADSAATLGARVLVAVLPGTHSCENLGNPLEYYVVTLGEQLATDGPLTTCVELTTSVTPGTIVLEEDVMGEGEGWVWSPGERFRASSD
jgi:hypothetical protein